MMADLEKLLGAGVLSTITLRRAKTFDGKGVPVVEWTVQLHVYEARPPGETRKKTIEIAQAGLVTEGSHVYVTGATLNEVLTILAERV